MPLISYLNKFYCGYVLTTRGLPAFTPSQYYRASPNCACNSIAPLRELPFLHSVANKDAQRDSFRLMTFILYLIYLLSGHLPGFIRSPLFRAIKWLDSLYFLAACYLEHVVFQTSVLICGRNELPGRRLSTTAGTYMRKMSESRFGSVVVRIGEHVDEDMAEIIRTMADSYEGFIDRVLPPAYTFVCDSKEPDKAQECQEKVDVRGKDNDEWKLETNMEVQKRLTSGSQVDWSIVGSLEVENGTDKQNESQDVSHNNSICDVVAVRHENPDNFDDEGYKSADEAPVFGLITICETSPATVQKPPVRSMLEPLEAAHVHPSDNPRFEIKSPTVAPFRTQIFNSQDSWNNKNLAFPSRKTFDDIPGLRRQSQTGIEAKRIVTISMEAASRAHHHWLRPCAACARKAGQEKSERKVEEIGGEKMAEEKESKLIGGVYKRTVHWVKRQEGRIKQL